MVATVALLPPQGKALRVQVTIDERLLARIDAVTKNRSAFLSQAALQVLEKSRSASLVKIQRGKERATLTPISSIEGANEKSAKAEIQPMFGLWSDREDMADPDSYVRPATESHIP